jgi:hypothetical protein
LIASKPNKYYLTEEYFRQAVKGGKKKRKKTGNGKIFYLLKRVIKKAKESRA